MESLRGKLLISSGGLYDRNFRHTVVLIGEHNPEGALGVILNRPLSFTVEDAVPSLGKLVAPGTPLYEGGPVRPTGAVVLAELGRPELAGVPVFGAVGFLTGEVSDEISPHIIRARVYVGYAGWGSGQLESEMAENAWIVEEAQEADVVTETPDLLWSQILERKGGGYRQMSRIPFDPSMN